MNKPTILSLFLIVFIFYTSGEAKAEDLPYSPANSECFSCHGGATYTYYNDLMDRTITKRMNPYFVIDSVLYYEQNHKSFECTDCHAYGFKIFPHDSELRMEPMPGCLDCHEGDDATAKYNFEEINEEFQESVHSTKHSEDFTCWMCHNPHSYKINARTNENIKETIVYDNNICLSCHADINKYQLITAKKKPNVIESHDWLPNQIAHFANVRCIECHTHTSENAMVAHQIQTKDKAVQKCVECHSKNSILMESLYKFRVQESRRNYGFLNPEILDDTYIIGANRNYYLNVLSAVIFGSVLLIVLIHAILRIIINSKKHD